MAAVWKAAGIDVISVASNHTPDWGPDALFDTIDMFRGMGKHVIGAFDKVGLVAFDRMWDNGFRQITEIYIFAGVLVLQSLPFLSAVAIAILENSRINAFGWWSSTAVRTAELIGLRPVTLPLSAPMAPAQAVAPQPVATDIQRDA